MLLAFGLLLSCSKEEVVLPQVFPQGTAELNRGRELVRGLAACGFCHGIQADPQAPLAGGQLLTDSYGDVRAPNITPAKTGIASWTPAHIMTLFRRNKRPDGASIAPEAHVGSEWMADSDLVAIAAYLGAQAPVENEVQARTIGFVDRNTTGFFHTDKEVPGFVPAIDPRSAVQYGQYLVDNIAHCGSCHHTADSVFSNGEYLGGGREIKNSFGEKIAPAINGSNEYGIGSWSESQVLDYLRSGRTPQGRVSDPNFCPISFFKNASEVDLKAMAAYLRSLGTGGA